MLANEALHGLPGVPLALRGPAPAKVVAGFGFWLFLLSDIIVFAALFATYAVLSDSTAGGPSGAELFEKPRVFLETMCLLASSVTCGFGTMAMFRTDARATYFWMGITFLLGLCFLTIEGREFASMVAAGAGPLSQRLSVSLLRARRNARLACQRGSDLAHRHAASGHDARLQAHGHSPILLLRLVLACARHRLDRRIHHRISGSEIVDMQVEAQGHAPGVDPHEQHGARTYLIGLG